MGQLYGGWPFVILDKIEWRVSGYQKNQTNNRMELKAVIEALTFCDSMYVIKGATREWDIKTNLDL